MARRWSWDNRHTGALDALTPFTVQCVCGWLGREDQMTERIERGASLRSTYGPSPDFSHLFCPECAAEDDYALGRFFKATRRKRSLHIHNLAA